MENAKRIVTVAVCGVLAGLLALAAPAVAQTCQAEIEKFCKEVRPGEGRVLNCLKENDAGLSDVCRAHVNAMLQYTACIDDAMRLCPGMQPGVDKGIACLRAHISDLSTECKRELHKIRP